MKHKDVMLSLGFAVTTLTLRYSRYVCDNAMKRVCCPIPPARYDIFIQLFIVRVKLFEVPKY